MYSIAQTSGAVAAPAKAPALNTTGKSAFYNTIKSHYLFDLEYLRSSGHMYIILKNNISSTTASTH